MTRTHHSFAGSRGTRGGTVARVLLIVLGTILMGSGLLFSVASCCILLDDADTSMFFLLPFTISSLLGGAALIYTQVRPDSAAKSAIDNTGARTAIPEVSTPIPTPVPAPEPTAGDAPNAAGGTAEDVAHLVARSEDLFATLRDLVRHEAGTGSDKAHLADMLQAAGVLAWPNAPACEGGRLSRNTHYWIRLNVDNLTDEQYDTLVSAEAALGVNQDLPSCRTSPCGSSRAKGATFALMRSMARQTIDEHPLADEGMRVCYHDADPTATPGEWLVRAKVCNAAECVKTPFRVVFDLRCNVLEGLVVLSLEVPRPRCMAIFTPNAAEQAGLARAYALRLGALLARHAFAASPKVKRVVVNCHEHDRDEVLLSLDLTQKVLEALSSVIGQAAVETAFPADDAIRASFSSTQWFEPVDPFVALDDPHAVPEQALIFPELDERPASAEVARTCHAQRICDLGINENAVRISAWQGIRPKLGGTTEQAVQALVAARNATRDITVAEACTRTIQALVEGDLDLDDKNAIATLFIDGSTLDRAVARAAELLDDTNGTEDPEAAAKLLEDALAPIDNMGAYLDDETNVYRYFGSVSERIHHNRTIDERGRTIRLVPDSYFNAHSQASIALGMLGQNERALEHADVCLHLAPTSTYATMRKVRILESESRIYEAADLIVEALRNAVTPRDAAICHYRLAYMEWKLGREDLAAACYRRSLNWDTEMAPQSREELDDLVSATPDLTAPTDEQADALLAREGIPLGCVRSDGERTLAAAVACIDDGALLSARPLMAALFGMNNDDVVMGVYRSLNVSL